MPNVPFAGGGGDNDGGDSTKVVPKKGSVSILKLQLGARTLTPSFLLQQFGI